MDNIAYPLVNPLDQSGVGVNIGTKIASTALICGSVFAAYGQHRDFSISIATAQTSFGAGKDIPIDISVNNISDHQIPIFVSPGESGIALAFEITVFDETGSRVTETVEGKNAHGKTNVPRTISGGTVMIPVGGNYKSTTHINKIFDLTKSGTYTVEVQKLDKTNKVLIKSNVLTITITP